MRISPSPAVGLIATHAALTAAVHGITGTIVGTTDTQTLTNKILSATSITVINAGVGADPILTSDSGSQVLDIAGLIRATLDFHFKSGTAFSGSLAHNISANKTWTFPDVTGNIVVDADTGKSLSLAQLTIENAGAGADPILTSDSAAQNLTITGEIFSSLRIRTDTNYEFKGGTAFRGIFTQTISANRSWDFPDIAGTVCMWNAANAAVTRYWALGAKSMMSLITRAKAHTWEYDEGNHWAQSTDIEVSFYPVHLPHGAVVTALRVTAQETGSGVLRTRLIYFKRSDLSTAILATVESTSTMVEVADTSIDNATVDNNGQAYYLEIDHQTNANEVRLGGIQIDYTVTAPQP